MFPLEILRGLLFITMKTKVKHNILAPPLSYFFPLHSYIFLRRLQYVISGPKSMWPVALLLLQPSIFTNPCRYRSLQGIRVFCSTSLIPNFVRKWSNDSKFWMKTDAYTYWWSEKLTVCYLGGKYTTYWVPTSQKTHNM